MKKEDIDGLFGLLNIYFPKDPRVKDKVLKNAWLLVLDAYSPEDVKQALVSFLRENKNFPFVQEIAMRCRAKIPAAAGHHRTNVATADMAQYERWQKEYKNRLYAALRAHDLPTSTEARKEGIAYLEWHRMIETEGIDTLALLEEAWKAAKNEMGDTV